MKKVIFGSHAEEKFKLLEERNFLLSKKQVLDCVKSPDKLEQGYQGRKIAQKKISQAHILRVVFQEFTDHLKIVTFYPARRTRYEDEL